MPELPEVEHLRRTLEPRLVGRRIEGVEVLRASVTRRHDSPGTLDAPRLLLGERIRGTARHGKQLAWLTDGPALIVQLGMTGGVFVRDRAGEGAHTHVRWRLEGGACVEFVDPRRFGGITGFPDWSGVVDRWQATLGPDALGIRSGPLVDSLAGRRTSIKAALLDQRVVAGIGNIYADEALFRARVDPHRPAGGLDRREVSGLAAAVRHILARAIELGGSSIRDYRDALDRPGRQQMRFLVYSRAGEPCRRCGRALRSCRLVQRATVWCSKCQPGRGVSI